MPGTVRRGVLAVVVVVVAGLASLAPALARGSQLGTFQVAYGIGLGAPAGAPQSPPYNALASDQVFQGVPWAELDWTEVHRGELPLWNPYSAMGIPELFDMQSAGLSLPALLSYAFPRRFAYDVTVIAKLIIAGTGMLFAGRVLRLGWAAAAFGAVVAELSGAFSGWLGWPMDSVLAWTGWVLGAGVLVASGRRVRPAVPLLAVALALAIYGEHPESLAILAMTVAIPWAATLLGGLREAGARALRRVVPLVGACVLAGCLGAPVLLPGAQVLGASVHGARAPYSPIPLHAALGLVFSGFFGYPISTSQWFGPLNYYETAGYVGLAALVLAVVGTLRWWRSAPVLGLGVTAAVLAAVCWALPVARLIDHLPFVHELLWSRCLIALDLLLGLLAGVGLQALAGAGRDRRTAATFAVLVAGGAAFLAAVGYHDLRHPPGGAAAAIRAASFRWPAAQAVLLIAAAAVLTTCAVASGAVRRLADRARPLVLGAVAAGEVGFLLLGTPNLWASSSAGFSSPAAAALAAAVGDQRVGVVCPNPNWFASTGLVPETNAAYGVAEAEMYDPVLPLSYFSEYARISGTPRWTPTNGFFCASVTSASVARAYGIGWVLTHGGRPPGTVRAGTIGGETLWRVPGGSVVSLQPAAAPLDDPGAAPVRFSERDPARLVLQLRSAGPARLELHIGAFPGWSARMDGRTLPLRRLHGDQLQTAVPAGAHRVVVTYLPRRFVEGRWIAAAGAGVLLAWCAAAVATGRGRRRGGAYRGRHAGVAKRQTRQV